MQHSAFQIAEQVQHGLIKSPSRKQAVSLAKALLKQRELALEARKQLEVAMNRNVVIEPVIPNASAKLVYAVEQFLEQKLRLRHSIYEGTVGAMNTALNQLKADNSLMQLVR